MSEPLAASKGDFSARGAPTGDRYEVRFSGNADMRSRDALDELLARLHQEAVQLECKEVVIDFHELEFMNSSCFKSVVAWIGRVQDLVQEQRYRIRFLSKPELLWQRRSLHALRCFAVDLITIET